MQRFRPDVSLYQVFVRTGVVISQRQDGSGSRQSSAAATLWLTLLCA